MPVTCRLSSPPGRDGARPSRSKPEGHGIYPFSPRRRGRTRPPRAGKKNALGIASYGVKGADLGVVETAKKLIENGEKTKVLELAGGDREKVTKEIIFEAAKAGDKVAKDILADVAYWLGTKVAYLVNIFNPQLVVIGGGMEKAGSIFMDSLASCVKMYAFEESFNAAKIMPSFLGEDAIAVGAASLGVRELFINA